MKSHSTLSVSSVALSCALFGGCASSQLPRDFEPSLTRIVATSAEPRLDVSGLPGGKPVGAGIGAGTGSGIGVVAGVAACAAAGPLVGVCLATILPATTAVGAVTGGAIGAVRTESSEALDMKRKTLAGEFSATPYQQRLSDRLQQYSGIATTSGAAAEARPWTLEVGIVEVGTEGKTEFAVRLIAKVQLRQGDATPVWQTTEEVRSATELTLGQWLADDSRVLRGVLDRCIDQAARQLAADLARSQADGPAAGMSRARYSSSCDDASLQDQQPTRAARPTEPASALRPDMASQAKS
jgi:hypothetical protein